MNLEDKLHNDGLTLDQMIGNIEKKALESFSNKVFDPQTYFHDKSAHKELLYFDYIINERNQRELVNQQHINDFINILLEGIYDYGKKGVLIASYTSNQYPVIIQPHEWDFIKIDIENSSAYYRDEQYMDIRFFFTEKLSTDELKQLKTLTSKKQEMVLKDNSTIDTERNKKNPDLYSLYKNRIGSVQNNRKDKHRKKLLPHIRDNNNGLSLIYEIFKIYKVEYLDELSASKAWGKLVSREFTSELVESISDGRRSVTLSGGDKLDKKDFSDKYRRRFK